MLFKGKCATDIKKILCTANSFWDYANLTMIQTFNINLENMNSLIFIQLLTFTKTYLYLSYYTELTFASTVPDGDLTFGSVNLV